MKRTIVIQDGLTLNYGRLEHFSRFSHNEKQEQGFNIFGQRLEPFFKEVRECFLILRMGDGIKTFKSQIEIDNFLVDLFLENVNPVKLYQINQLHSKVIDLGCK